MGSRSQGEDRTNLWTKRLDQVGTTEDGVSSTLSLVYGCPNDTRPHMRHVTCSRESVPPFTCAFGSEPETNDSTNETVPRHKGTPSSRNKCKWVSVQPRQTLVLTHTLRRNVLLTRTKDFLVPDLLPTIGLSSRRGPNQGVRGLVSPNRRREGDLFTSLLHGGRG